jgi:hypothetical protein
MFSREFFISTPWKILMRPFSFIATQSSEEKPPDSDTSSETSLGKRKASDLSSSSTIASGPFRPPKVPRSFPQPEEDKSPDNPFVDHSPPEPEAPENPFAPIIIVRPCVQHTGRFGSDSDAYNLVAREKSPGSIHGEKAPLWGSI